MEQIGEHKAASRTFSDDLSAVYGVINEYRGKANAKDDCLEDKQKSRNLAFFVTVVALAIIGILYAGVRFFVPTLSGSSETIRLILQLVVLLSYVLAGVAILFQYLSVKDLYQGFTGQVIGFAADAANDEAQLFEGLDELSTESIKYVANRLENSSIQLGQIRTFLLGAIEKVGIIPGLLATVIAISSLADKTGFAWIEFLSVFMFGIYLSMFPITEAALKIKRVSVLLEQYLLLFRSNEENKTLQQNTFGGGHEHVKNS